MQSGKTFVVLIFTFMITLAFACNAWSQARLQPYQTGELLVKYKTSTAPISKSALHTLGLVRSARAIGNSEIHRIVLEPGTTVEQALAIYANDPNIDIVEPNYIIQAQTIPNDTGFSKQWGLYNTGQVVNGYHGSSGMDMDAPQAWDITTNGNKVIVAVLDTGCNFRHLDLAANIWSNPGEIPGDGRDNDGNGFIDDIHGWDFADGNNDPSDASGHGTHVAGIIAAAGNNQRGITGVAWEAQIMSIRIMNAFDIGTTADAINAIHYAVDNGAKIINCSWGSTSYSSALRHAIAEANALFVCASGNNGKDTDATAYYPASYNAANIISVAASDQMDRLAWFSNYGTVSTDVAAPGTRIYSLGNRRDTIWTDDFNDSVLDGWATGGLNNQWDAIAMPGSVGTSVLTSSPDRDDDNNADAWAQLPTLNLADATAALLTFRHTSSVSPNDNHLYLEISTNGSTWINLPLKIGGTVKNGGITGSVPYWTTALADLGPWDGEPQVYLRLRFLSNNASAGDGFYIDDFRLSVVGASDSYQFMQGTSMATGYVSGLAALIQSEEISLTPSEIKFIIENSVDLNQNLLEKVGSGGRVNIYNALTLLRELSLNADMFSQDRVRLSWTGDMPLEGLITIQRRTDNESEFSAIAQVDAKTGNFLDEDVLSDSTYYYRVQAQTPEGDHRYSHQTLAGTITSGTGNSSGGGGGGGCYISVLGGP